MSKWIGKAQTIDQQHHTHDEYSYFVKFSKKVNGGRGDSRYEDFIWDRFRGDSLLDEVCDQRNPKDEEESVFRAKTCKPWMDYYFLDDLLEVILFQMFSFVQGVLLHAFKFYYC